MIEERMILFQSYGRELPHAKVYYREDWIVFTLIY